LQLGTRVALQSELTGKLAGPSGRVRVSVSSVIAQALLTPSLPSLYERHPQLHLDILADDLGKHRLIGNSASPALNQWQLGRGREATTLQVSGHTRTDSTAVALSLVREGDGIGRVVSIVAGPMVARGELVPVLADLTAETPVPVYAVLLHMRQRLPEMRACIDHWAAGLAEAASPARQAERPARRTLRPTSVFAR
jgi:DNA-binding transcriptional LysR family regulator